MIHTSADTIIEKLSLQPHPEGGYFREGYRSPLTVTLEGCERPALTTIRYLLDSDGISQWHRIDAEEVWQWQEGGPMMLWTWDENSDVLECEVLAQGDHAMAVVSPGIWQSARPLREWSLVSCLVAPGFVWEGFELMENNVLIEQLDQRATGKRGK